jgi:hypothetical protein
MTRSTLAISEPHSRKTSGVQAARSLSVMTKAWLCAGGEITQKITLPTRLTTLHRRTIAFRGLVLMACSPKRLLTAPKLRASCKRCYTIRWALESAAREFAGILCAHDAARHGRNRQRTGQNYLRSEAVGIGAVQPSFKSGCLPMFGPLWYSRIERRGTAPTKWSSLFIQLTAGHQLRCHEAEELCTRALAILERTLGSSESRAGSDNRS